MKNDLLSRRVEKVLPDVAALEKLLTKRPIRLYQGFDPTGSRLHLGHSIGLKKLMEFAAAGHEVIFLFGTGTVLVGDPSQRDTGRALITQDEIDENIKDWKRQVKPIVDFDKVSIKQNGDWLTKLTLKDIVKIASNISAIQLFKRESFQRRLDRGDTVWYHETMYPLLQGYDSVAMDVDLEIGGTDQEFNMLMGRELLRKMNNKDKFVLTLPMIMGTDGKQMSKSSGNCVWLDDTADDMYGKLMALPDGQIIPYLTLVTDVEMDEIKSIETKMQNGDNPKEFKERLAYEVVKMYHSEKDAKSAASNWSDTFSSGNLPKDIEEVELTKGDWNAIELLVALKLASSNSEARRLLDQGGVRINQEAVNGNTISVDDGDVVQVGKRRFVRVRLT